MSGRLRFIATAFEVQFKEGALASFDANRQKRCFHREAGGQLFGNLTPDRWMVDFATGPRASDKRSRFGFEPNRAHEQEEIKQYHARGFDYLGDWHTHPEDIPHPSRKDEHSINDIVRSSEHHLPGFLLCIVGRSAFPKGLWVSFHTRTGKTKRVTPLAEVTESPIPT